MKFTSHYILILAALSLGLASCKKDNMEAPSSTLNGRLTYNGEEIGLEFGKVSYELYQPGFGKTGAMASTFAQDGTYSSLLFDGNYKLIIPKSQGPFMWRDNTAGGRDTLAITMSGNQTLDLQVVPYYLIRNVAYTVAGRVVTANFRIDKIITDANAKNIEKVFLFVNKTQFVSGTNYNIANAELLPVAITNPASVSMNVTVPAITPTQNYVFARVAVQISGIEDLIFSPLQKVQL